MPLKEERILALQRGNLKRNEAKIERFRNSIRQKRRLKDRETYQKYRKKFSSISESEFFVSGLMLYLGEGS